MFYWRKKIFNRNKELNRPGSNMGIERRNIFMCANQKRKTNAIKRIVGEDGSVACNTEEIS